MMLKIIYKQYGLEKDVALLDSTSTHTILTNPKFSHLKGNDEP